MSVKVGPQATLTGLIFHYDSANTLKSWKGKPTTNYVYTQNPRVDTSYSSYVATATGTWTAKHPDAIRVYNDDGTEITGYVNTGVTDWTNTYHAIWAYDADLKRPVVIMRDLDGQWKAKSYGLGQTYTSMGLSAGSTYTISWLQWTSNISKSAQAGIYSPNTGGSYNFWDGQSNSYGTAFNTLVNTWERVYATFTVSSGLNYTAGLSVYMYGMYGPAGTLKITDVQLEPGSYSGFTQSSTRSSTQSILDMTGNNTINTINLTYDSNNTFSFNGSSNYIDAYGPGFTSGMTAYTIMHWSRRDVESRMPISFRGGPTFYQYGDNSWYYTHGGVAGEYYYPHAVSIPVGTYGFYCIVYNGTNVAIYRNGTLEGTQSTTGTADWSNGLRIGNYYGSGYYYQGKIDSVSMYNVALTADQVKEIYYAKRGNYGLT